MRKNSTRVTRSAKTRTSTTPGTRMTAGIRRPRRTSAASAVESPWVTPRDIRVKRAVTSETVTSECGSMKRRKALSKVARPGPTWCSASIRSEARVRTCEVMTKPSWATITAAKVHAATFPAEPNPTPRNPQTGRYRKPMRRRGMTRKSACRAIDSVLDPARIQIIVGVQSAGPTIDGCPDARK